MKRPFPRTAGATVVAALLLAAAAFAAAPRTIVVRGHVLAPDGVPLAGARVTARGSASVNTLADAQGRYTLSVPLGMPAGLRTAPFKLEVRAEASGRRLPLAGGGSALVLEAAWNAATGRVRVQSNRQGAATAVATAIEVEGVTTAWIDADFGGGAKEGGSQATFAQEAALAGSAPAESSAAKPKAASPAAAVPVTPPPPAAAAPRDSAPAKPVPSTVAGPPPAPAKAAAVPAPKTASSTRTAPAEPPRNPQVRAVAPDARRDSTAFPADCRCTLRGTVEIDWTRPLELSTPVRVELLSPQAPPVELSLFMGAPREFRFGPLPCGEWKLRVRATGKVRLADATGDTLRVLRCAGATETRVVLVPAKR